MANFLDVYFIPLLLFLTLFGQVNATLKTSFRVCLILEEAPHCVCHLQELLSVPIEL
jgi:hypothetical protein